MQMLLNEVILELEVTKNQIIKLLPWPLPGIIEIHYFGTSGTIFVKKNEGLLIIFKTFNNMLPETQTLSLQMYQTRFQTIKILFQLNSVNKFN